MLLTSFDLLLAGISIAVFFTGIAKLRSTWHMGREADCSGDWKGLFSYLLGHKRILRNRLAGVAHLALFWGVAFPLFIAILTQLGFSVPVTLARLFSFLGDVLGIILLAGILVFLIKRARSRGPEAPKRVLFPLGVLLVIVLGGFLAEGARLQILDSPIRWYTPVGSLLTEISPSSPLFMQVMIRIHFFAVLLFIAILPFTFMRHLIAGSLNVFYRNRGALGETLGQADPEKRLLQGHMGVNEIADFTWKQLLDAQSCVSCGRCDDHCPALISGKALSPRKIIRTIREQMEAPSPALFEDTVSPEEIWACTTCMACVEKCPVFIPPVDKLLDMRKYRVMGRGSLPEEARGMIRDLEIFGDTYGKGPPHKADWALNTGIPHTPPAQLQDEILLWVGCSGAFHPRYQGITRCMVRILQAGKVPFSILGHEELCCGDPARRLGDEEQFLTLAKKNIHTLDKYGFKKIVTLCPHCFNTLKNEYPVVGGNPPSGSGTGFQVVHAVELVMDLIDQKKITLKYPVEKSMAIHDACYLGRGNRIYEPLRSVAGSVPGIRVKELERNREDAFCCGGGGGRMWLHENMGKNINQIRAEEVSLAGVQLVGTACPYCLTMLEDGVSSLELENPPGVMDIIEIVDSSLGRTY
jgi:Fe-S oxidoreductase/nitrate reductase gamma subunit